MKLNKLASTLQRCTWLIDSRAVDRFYPLAERFLAGETVSFFENNKDDEEKYLQAFGFTKENEKWMLQASNRAGTNQGFYADTPDDSIAMITIEGTIMKDDGYCGTVGTDTIGAMLMDALHSPSIIGVVFKMNSPGGTVEGTAELEEIVALVASLKPVEVYTDGQLCSAAYWIASPCRITASSGTVEIGSIGTAASFNDYSKGSTVVSHFIPADKSFDKQKDSRQALKGNYTPIKENIINPTNDIFHDRVKTNRGERLQLTEKSNDAGDVTGEEPLTGQVYLAQRAIDLGLIDTIGNLQSVLDSIRSRSESEEFSNQQTQNSMSLFGKKNTSFKTLTAIKSKKAEDITEEEVLAINEEFTTEGFGNLAVISAAHLEEANTNADAIESGLSALNSALGLEEGKGKTSLTEAITALVADHKIQVGARAAAEKLADEYGDQPGEKPTVTTTTAESEGSPIVADREQTSWEKKASARGVKTK